MRKAHKAVAGVTAPAMTAALPLAGLQPAAGSPPGDPGPTVSDPSTVGPHELPNRLEDKHMWWSESGDDLENTMSRPVDLTAATTAALTLRARYEIEAGFDYLYVQASIDGGTTCIRVVSVDSTSMRIGVSSR